MNHDHSIEALTQALAPPPSGASVKASRQSTVYRRDIDGLRAIAVLSVVLYHFGLGPLHGGFVGVDVFFVISGYLITGIIHREVVEGCFTFAGFYERRVRRIFPALLFMLTAVVIAGSFLLLPSDLVNLSKSVLATLGCGSNILFWRTSGYFDSTSEFNALLHTWSLAVEEQFYIGFPILLLLVERYARKWLKPILFAAGLFSFALCIYFQSLRPTATFYLSPFRAWELLAGGLLAVGAIPSITSPKLNRVLAAFAMALLLGSLWLIRSGLDFPGWPAALPVIATAALIHSGTVTGGPVSRALSFGPLVFLGRISYSLYLWHWPLLVYAKYHQGMAPLSNGQGLALMVVSVVCAYISYEWVETPFRQKGPKAIFHYRKSLFAAAFMGVLLLGSIALTCIVGRGWPSRVPSNVAALDSKREQDFPNKNCDGKVPDGSQDACRVGKPTATTRIMLLGDSHAMVWSPAITTLGQRINAQTTFAFHHSCPPLQGVRNPVSSGCEQFNHDVFKMIKTSKPDAIIMVASWLSYSIPGGQYTLEDDAGHIGNAAVFGPALQRTIEMIAPYTHHIILVGPTPGSPSDPHFHLAMAKWHGSHIPSALSEGTFADQVHWFRDSARSALRNPKVRLVDPAPWFCDGKMCNYQIGGRVMYRDGGHLSLDGADFIASKFRIDQFMGQSPT